MLILKSGDGSSDFGNMERRKNDFTNKMESYIGNYTKITIKKIGE